MFRAILISLALAVAACNAPTPELRGIAPVRVVVADSTFDVRVLGLRAQAIRVNTQWAPRLQAVMVQAVAAMQAVSGCRVARLAGDAAVAMAALDCGDGPPPEPRGPLYLDCDLYKLDEDYGSLDCYASPRPPSGIQGKRSSAW